jgi:hypothetical protein
MRIEKLQSIVLVAFVLSGAVGARAQSLAEVAQQEEARRNASGSSGKAYTNSDLRPVPPASAAPAPPVTAGRGPAAGGATGAAATATADEVSPGQGNSGEIRSDEIGLPDAQPSSARGEEFWRKRMSDIREQLDRDTSYAEAMQTRVDVLTLDFTTRGDAGQRIRIAVDRQKAMADLERLTKAVEDGKKAMADLEEEARQAGALSGWLR